jgi:hypothetical protein
MRHDRAHHPWPRQLGLAALFDEPDEAIACGDLTLVANSNVRWLAVQRVSRYGSGSRRLVPRATAARARLRFGMPHLSFAERPGACSHVTRIPVPDGHCRRQQAAERPMSVEAPTIEDRLPEVLAGLVASMAGTNSADRPNRQPPPPGNWFPVAYLGFATASADDLFRLATQEQAVGRTLRCRGCGRDIDLTALGVQDQQFALSACPVCGRVQRWALNEAVPARFTRHVSVGFMRRFCGAVADRLPLAATGPVTYSGRRPFWPERDRPKLPDARSRRLELVVHEFRCGLSGEQWFVYLPPSAVIEASPGQSLRAGQVWCRVMASGPDAGWRSVPRPLQYTAAERVLGGDAWCDHLKRVWFDHQGITCTELGEHQRLWPADLVAFAAGGPLRPLGLYWDFTPARRYVDPTTAAAAFPTVQLGRDCPWRTTLPGEVALDAELDVARPAMVIRRGVTSQNVNVRLARRSMPRRLAS